MLNLEHATSFYANEIIQKDVGGWQLIYVCDAI